MIEQKTESYNGYTNYETWLMSLNLDNEQPLNEMVMELANKQNLGNYEKAQSLKEQIEELFYIEEHGIIKICDAWTLRDFQEIDWIDIIESHIEES